RRVRRAARHARRPLRAGHRAQPGLRPLGLVAEPALPPARAGGGEHRRRADERTVTSPVAPPRGVTRDPLSPPSGSGRRAQRVSRPLAKGAQGTEARLVARAARTARVPVSPELMLLDPPAR